jgi:hypothetical protein
MPAAFRLLIDNHRQLAVARDVRQEMKGGICAVSRNQLLPENGNRVAARDKHAFLLPSQSGLDHLGQAYAVRDLRIHGR